MEHLHPNDGRAVAAGEMRSLNASLLLGMIWEGRSVSRAELSRRTGLSRSTVSAIVDDLGERGLVRLGRLGASQGGRPPTMVEFCTDTFAFCGVDIGATHITTVLVDAYGRELASARATLDTRERPDEAMSMVRRHLDAVRERADGEELRLVGVGLAVPSPVDSLRPFEMSPAVMPAWSGRDLIAEVRAHTDVHVLVENDANAGAVAERWWGAGRDVRNLTYIKLGTGVGAGHVLRGELYRGTRGTAGEIGHFAIDPRGPRCACGLRGCLTTLVGTPELLDRTRVHLQLPAGAAITIAVVLDAARRGDPRVGALCEEMGDALGTAIAGLLNLLDPEMVVLGGQISALGDQLLTPLRDAIRTRALFTSVANTEIAITDPIRPPISASCNKRSSNRDA